MSNVQFGNLTPVSSLNSSDQVLVVQGGVAKRAAVNNVIDAMFTLGTTAPSSTPSRVSLFYLDTSAKKLYVSTGTSSSADWTILN